MKCNICTKKLEGGGDIYDCVKNYGVTSVILSLQPQQRFMEGFFVLKIHEDKYMAFFGSAVDVLKVLVIALGAGLGIWGAINLLEGYGNDNPGAKSQGMKQLMAGGGVALIGTTLVPLLANLFS